jgi:ABC-type Fe3+ transport system substrate-binding protein
MSDMHEFGGRALRAYTFFSGVQYNSKLVRPNEVPRKTGDVFKPHWKGKIASTIYAAQFDRLALIKGVEETRAIVHKTAEWAGGLIRCGDEERIVSGEFILLFLTCTQQRTELMKSQGAPIDYTLLDDGLMTGFAYVAVPKSSPHPNLAKLFLGYIVSKEGQAILDKFGYSLHLVEGTKSYKRYHVYAQRGLKFQENSATEAVGRSDEINKLREEFQKILQRK